MTERAGADHLRLSVADTPVARARTQPVVARLAAAGVGAEVVVCPGGHGDPTGRLAALARVRDGGADAAVHGGDELPVELPDGLVVAATPARIDPRDALVSRAGWGLATLPRDRPVSVAVSGAGRRAQLQRQRRDLVLSHGAAALEDRLDAVERGDLDAVVVGIAELLLARPASTSLVVVPLEHGEVLHPPGQGTTVVTCARTAAAARKALARVDDATTRAELDAERELWRQLSQDDDPLVGAHAEMRVSATGQPRLVLLGLRTDATGSRSARASHETAPDEAVTLGRAMAATLLEATSTPDAHGH
jgi:hydroxymethylbilane synthase